MKSERKKEIPYICFRIVYLLYVIPHIHGIWKNGTDELIFRAGINPQIQKTDFRHSRGRRGSGTETYT